MKLKADGVGRPVPPPGDPAWLIENIPVLSTLTDAQYSALRKCDFWDAVAASATP
jgi:hypothetical protein